MSYAHWTSPDDASPHGVELTPSAHAGSSAKAAVTTGGGTALVVPPPPDRPPFAPEHGHDDAWVSPFQRVGVSVPTRKHDWATHTPPRALDADLFAAMVGAIVVLDLLRRFLRWLARLGLVHRPRRVGEL